ncbi:MAG: O-antigen ligase family protein [Lachnospiraceae bacterium]|nr:O-antigen ligase family protein [Lachnospiraceae bacterium]
MSEKGLIKRESTGKIMEDRETVIKADKSILITLLGYILFVVYPLIFHDYYYDIVTCKFFAFIAITIFFLVTFFALKRDNKTDIDSNMHMEEKMVWLLFLINSISFFLSDYKLESLIGAEGRNNGMLTIGAYLVLYLCITSEKIKKERILIAVIIGSIPVSLFGIFNFIDIDLLGFYNGLSMQYKQFYMSTLGHINVYSSYFSITLPVVLAFYLNEKRWRWKISLFIASLINVVGLITSGCESAIIIIVVAVICNIIKNKEINVAKWYVLMVWALLLTKFLAMFNMNQNEKRQLSRFMVILSSNHIVFGLIIVFGILFIIDMIKKSDKKNKIIKFMLLGLIFIIISAYLIVLFYFSVLDKKTELGKWSGFLRINDEFGSYRGYIWRIVIEEFKELSFVKKIFGVGPDVLYPLVYEKYGNEMYKVTNAYYDNAHNEILQYLITTGIAGVVTYISFLGVKVKRFISLKGQSECNKIIMCSCICYFIQSFVNINQVVTTPLFVIMLCMLNAKEET